jgi:acyl carrier protein
MGDLWIGGAGLARGYCGEPGLTADRFRPDPFPGVAGARIYRTGDLACAAASEEIEFRGRADFQVKVDGYRIELGEIESVLAGIEDIADAAAAVRNGADGRAFLVGYVVPRNGSAIDSAFLRSRLQDKLPPYMIPSRWVTLPALPLTPNRKLDRKALPAPDCVAKAVMAAPRNLLEEALAEMWKDAFAVEQISVTADFFELGGDSLLATQMHVKLSRVFQSELPLRDLFRNRTIESLALLLTSREAKPGQAEKIARAWLTIRRMTPEQKKELAARVQRS